LPGAWPPAKADLPGAILCREALAMAFGKEIFCRVPDKKLPANRVFPVVLVDQILIIRKCIFKKSYKKYASRKSTFLWMENSLSIIHFKLLHEKRINEKIIKRSRKR